jgi:hypothetical protein
MDDYEDQEEWACRMCTFQNPWAAANCQVCLAPEANAASNGGGDDTTYDNTKKSDVAQQRLQQSAVPRTPPRLRDTAAEYYCRQCTFVNARTAKQCGMCACAAPALGNVAAAPSDDSTTESTSSVLEAEVPSSFGGWLYKLKSRYTQ